MEVKRRKYSKLSLKSSAIVGLQDSLSLIGDFMIEGASFQSAEVLQREAGFQWSERESPGQVLEFLLNLGVQKYLNDRSQKEAEEKEI